MHVDLPSQMTFRVDLVNKLDLQILKVSKSNLLKALVSVWRFESFFSRMRSKGSRFTLAVWGLRVCSLDAAFMSATVRNRSQPFATVRNRSRVGRMAVPIVSSAKGVTFGCFQRCVAAFRVAGVAFRDIQTCFVTCGKSFCVAGAILLRRFQTMRCSFRGRHTPHSTLNTSHSTLYTLHSALYTLHSTLYTLRSTLHTLHLTLHI